MTPHATETIELDPSKHARLGHDNPSSHASAYLMGRRDEYLERVVSEFGLRYAVSVVMCCRVVGPYQLQITAPAPCDDDACPVCAKLRAGK